MQIRSLAWSGFLGLMACAPEPAIINVTLASTGADPSGALPTSTSASAGTASGAVPTSGDPTTTFPTDGTGGTGGSLPTTTAEAATSMATDGGAATLGETTGDTGIGACPMPTRCGQAGRERCMDGAWVSAPCPLDTPACAAGECVLRGPSMVNVGSFYADSTEVTSAQYQEFLASNPDPTAQSAVCAWNTSFWNDAVPFNPAAWPVTSVDWCDARAYCGWAGKHLCGAIGGGPIDSDDGFFEPTLSQWMLACGGPNGNSHPNLNSTCNGSGTLADVGSFTGCEGFYPGLFDLEGNAAEWVDACDGATGPDDACYLAGGSYVQNGFCSNVLIDTTRSTTAITFGFRCCSG